MKHSVFALVRVFAVADGTCGTNITADTTAPALVVVDDRVVVFNMNGVVQTFFLAQLAADTAKLADAFCDLAGVL